VGAIYTTRNSGRDGTASAESTLQRALTGTDRMGTSAGELHNGRPGQCLTAYVCCRSGHGASGSTLGHAFSLNDNYFDYSTGFQTQLGFIQSSNFRNNRFHSEISMVPEAQVLSKLGP